MNKIAVIPGDGIGKEICAEAVRLLESLMNFEFIYLEAGLECFKKNGTNLPEETTEGMKEADASILGPCTTPFDLKNYRSSAIKIREALDLFANIRPMKSLPIPCIAKDADFIIVRENTEGLYSGIEWRTDEAGYTLRIITKKNSERISRVAFDLAMKRRKKVTIVHKANVVRESDGVFRETCLDVSKNYSVDVNEKIIDAMAASLVSDYKKYDVIVAPNLYGDILSDLGAQLIGSIGIAPSANVGEKYAVFGPVHGSAPDIAGKNMANPIATFLSAKMMLEHLGYNDKAVLIEDSVKKVLEKGIMTADLKGSANTREFTDAVINEIKS